MNQRVAQLETLLSHLQVDALLLENPTQLRYLTGISVSRGGLLCRPSYSRFLVDSRYFETCVKRSPVPTLLFKKSPLDQLLEGEELQGVSRLGFDAESLSVATHQRWQLLLDERVTLVPLQNPLASLRALKDPEELEALKKAAELGSRGYDYALSLLKEGITELQVAKELEVFWLRQGGDALAFNPIIAFGANTSIPHYSPAEVPLKSGQPILLDIGVTLKDYHSDMTRVVFLGEPDERMKQLYQLVLKGQELALSLCRPGVSVGTLDQAVRDLFAEEGLADKFTHSLGHGIGLEVHEAPLLRSAPPHGETLLRPHMVITIEPGLYLEGVGGVRIEDTVAITEDGYHNLTNRPKKLQVLHTP